MKLPVLESIEQRRLADRFIRTSAYMIAGGGDPRIAEALAKARRADDALVQSIRSAVTAPELGATNPATDAWLASHIGESLVDACLARGAWPIPEAGSRAGIITATIPTAPGEGAPKIVSGVTLDPATIVPAKGAGVIVATREFLAAASPAVMAALDVEMAGVVGTQLDTALIALLQSGSPSPSVFSLGSINDDLLQLLRLVPARASDQLVFGLGLDAYMQWQALPTDAMPSGMSNVAVVQCSALPADDGILVNPSRTAISQTSFDRRFSSEAAIDLGASPTNNSATPTPSDLTSLWQSNSTAMIIERHLRLARLTDTASATLTEISWLDAGSGM